MVFGTPNEDYDATVAATLLEQIGQELVSKAESNLLQRNVLSKAVRDPQKSRPGRTLKISELYVNAC